MKFSFSFATGEKPEEKACPPTRTGWEDFGIPKDAGDGFAYNAEGRLWGDHAVSEKAILQLSAAMACVRLLSQTIATLPVGIYRRMPDGSRKAAPDNALYELLHNQPNADMTAVDFWQVMIAMMLLRGTGFAEIDRIGERVVALTPLSKGCVTWQRLQNGERQFTYTYNGKSRVIPRKNLWILPAFTMDGELGLSPICYGANVFSGALSVDQASNQTFSSGMAASGFVSYGKDSNSWLKKDQREQLQESLNKFTHRGAKAGGVFVLEGGMGYTALAMNPEDAQMLETRSFNVEEICRWFGVPPTLIGHGDKTSNWGTGLEQQNLSFLTYSLRPWLAKIEQSIRKTLLPAAEKGRYFAEFSVEGLLRADTQGRGVWYRAMTDIGAYSIDDVRDKENMPKLGGNAAMPTVQAARVPLERLGEAAPTTPPAQEPVA